MAHPRPAPVSAPPSVDRAEPPASVAGEPLSADICVIGAGAGGMHLAAAAAAFGRKVVLVEKHRASGEHASVGSVPSKALLAAATRANLMRTSGQFGLAAVDPQIDHRAVQAHVRGVVASVAPNASAERLSGIGVRVVQGSARFIDKTTIHAGDYRITARRFVIATGSSPLVPSIPGLDGCPYLTSDSAFDADRKMPELAIIGGGPAGIELAQAYARLGSRVAVIEAARVLGREDAEATAVVLDRLRAEGIAIREQTRLERVENMPGFVRIHVTGPNGAEWLDCSHLLFAVGRRPNLSSLNLDAAGVRYSANGIAVNRSLRTSNRRVYAVGDVSDAGQGLAHAASYQAEVALRNILFRWPVKADPSVIPRVIYTDPELAHVGLTEDEARNAGHKIGVLRAPFVENDAAHTERDTDGHVKVVVSSSGRVLGATIVGTGAANLIQVWALAVAQRLPVKAVMGMVAPHPTRSEASRRAALRFYATTPASSSVRRLIDLLARFG